MRVRRVKGSKKKKYGKTTSEQQRFGRWREKRRSLAEFGPDCLQLVYGIKYAAQFTQSTPSAKSGDERAVPMTTGTNDISR